MSKAHAVVARNTCTITLHYPTLHHTTQHHTTPDHTTPYHTTTTIAATTATTIAKYKYTTLHCVTLLTLQYSTTTATAALHHTTSSSCGWGDRCNHCSHSKKYSSNLNHVDSLCHPCVATIHLSYSVLYNETFATALCGTTGKTCFQLSCHALPAFRWCFCNVTAFNMSDLQHPCQYHTHGLHESRLWLWEWKALPSERWNLRKMMEEYLAAVEAGNPWANNCNYLPQAWHENAWKGSAAETCVTCAWKAGKQAFGCQGRILRPTLWCNFGRGQPTFSWFNERDPWRCKMMQGQGGEIPRLKRQGALLQWPIQILWHTNHTKYSIVWYSIGH